MKDLLIALRAAQWILMIIGIVLWIPVFVLVVMPALHAIRSSPGRLAGAEYEYRKKHRHWGGYEPVFGSHKPW